MINKLTVKAFPMCRGLNEMYSSSEKGPIIVGGCMRSGTTLFSTILDTHHNIACGYETELLLGRRFIKDKLYKLKLSYKVDDEFTEKDLLKIKNRLLKYPNIDDKSLEEILIKSKHSRSAFAKIFFQQYLHEKQKERWADKTPGNTFFSKDLLNYYQNAKFIHIVRDFRDFFLSYRNYYKSLNINTTIFRAAYYWNRNWEFIRQEKYLGNSSITIRYEDLIINTEKVLRGVFNFLDEEFDDKCLHYYEYSHDKENKNHVDKIKKPIDKENIYKFRKLMSSTDKYLSLLLCGKLLKYYGYNP